MAIRIVGINHKTAPVEVRERVAFAPESVSGALDDLCSLSGISEAVIVSTCNRTELYISGELTNKSTQLNWLANHHSIELNDLERCAYCLDGEHAVRHVMRVASGLDSMVLGEPQILGQLKAAFAEAQRAQCVGSDLSRLFRQVFTIAKRVRTQTAIGENPVSVAFAAVRMAQRIFADISKTQVLLIGAGDTIQLVARHLVQAGVSRLVVANRTMNRAEPLVQEFQAQAILIEDIPSALANADMVISSTASPLPILGKGMVEQTLKHRKRNPMFLVDLAVPRDIEAGVSELTNAYLYTVDDLRDIVDENVRSREQAAEHAEELISAGVELYLNELKTLDAVSTVTQVRTHIEGMFDEQLHKALKQIQTGSDPERVLKQFSHVVSQKVLHSPTLTLRRAGEEQRLDVLDWTRELFQLPDDSTPQ